MVFGWDAQCFLTIKHNPFLVNYEARTLLGLGVSRCPTCVL